MRRLPVAGLLVAGLLLQTGAIALSGSSDVREFKTWAITILDRRFFDAYSYDIFVPPTGVSPIPDYPPLSVAMLAASAHVARWIRADVTRDSRLVTVCVKAPLLLFQLIVLWGVHRLSRGASELTGTLGNPLLWFWLNPAFILSGPALGYLDLPCWTAGLAALFAADAGRAGLAGVLIAASLLFKPQGLFFALPLAAMLWTRPSALWRTALIAGAIVVLALLPFALRTPHGLWISLSSNFTEDMLSGDALNVWWLVSAAGFFWTFGSASLAHPFGAPPISMFIAHAGFDPSILAALVVTGSALWLFWRGKDRAGLLSAVTLGALVVHIYFAAGLAVHENHLVYALPLIGVAALRDARYRRLYIAASAFIAFNLLVMVGLGVDFPRLPRTGLFLPLTVAGAIAGVGLLAWHARIFRAAASATAGTARPTDGRAP